MHQKTLLLAICIMSCVLNAHPVCAQSVNINFQPPGESPAGYLPDHGEVFGDRGNGFRYGWDANRMDDMYNRHSGSFSDLKHDTVFSPSLGSIYVWEIALESGAYDVVIVCGTPRDTFPDNTLNVEGVILADPDLGDSYDEFTAVVAISDGRLTIGSDQTWPYANSSICFVDIKSHVPHKASFAPFPEDLASKVPIDVQLHWISARPGHTYNLYLGQSLEHVNEAAVPMATGLDVNAFDPGRWELNQTYYWRVDEVNVDNPQLVHPGPVWTFTTHDAWVVDDFERYNLTRPNRPWRTWLDGIGFSSSDDYFPDGYAGNGTGGVVGYDVWMGGPRPVPIMEHFITIAGSSQSMPFHYSGHADSLISQTDRLFDPPEDWSAKGSQTLVLHFYGKSTNPEGSLYTLINDEKVVYPDNEDLKRAMWHEWPIDLTALDTNLEEVTTLSIGVEGPGEGMLLLDDILLFPGPRSPVAVTDPGGDGLKAMYTMDGHTLDVSGHGHDGVTSGEPTYEEGAAGKALALDGSGSQYVDLGSLDPSQGTGQFTVSMWVKRTGYTPAYQGLMGKRDSSSVQDMMWQIEVNQNNGVVSLTRPDEQVAGNTPGLPKGEWGHMGVTYNGEVARLYVHGLQTGSGPFTLGPDTDAALVLGACEANGGHPFHGVIDEVAIYNRALSQGELRYLAGDR